MTPGDKLDEECLIAVLLDVATDKYQSVSTAIENAKGRELTLSDLETVMIQHYQQINRSKGHRSEREPEEVLLSAFNGACFRCGKKGHCANQSPDKKVLKELRVKLSQRRSVLIAERPVTELHNTGIKRRTVTNDRLDSSP